MSRRPRGRVKLYSSFNFGTIWGRWSTPRPGRFTPGKETRPFYRKLGGPHGRSGRVRKISPPPEFDSQTAKPVASRYTDYAMPAPRFLLYTDNSVLNRAVRISGVGVTATVRSSPHQTPAVLTRS